LLELHWLPEGYTMPNQATYPWQWLWDSCFHAIVWAELGDERCVTEIERLFAFQAGSGFVPHMNYHPDPAAGEKLWGRMGSSTITQPPMYGHAIVELGKRGFEIAPELAERAAAGLRFLLSKRSRTAGGLVELVHPWESGCDDSARWQDALAAHGYSNYPDAAASSTDVASASGAQAWSSGAHAWSHRLKDWRKLKISLLSQVEVDSFGGAISSPGFAVGSVGFNALLAFNANELAPLVNDAELAQSAQELGEIVTDRWDADQRTWIDDGAFAQGSGRVRTVDAHFCLLVDNDSAHTDAAVQDLVDPRAYGAPFGPRGAHRDEPTYDPDTYWRGPAWPQMNYLLWKGCVRAGATAQATELERAMHAGATRSNLAEFWNPETGEGRGAIPQSWATLALVVC